MADKYLGIDSSTGLPTETEGTVVSSGAGDAGAIPALDPAGKLDPTVMPTGVGAQTKNLAATELLAAGDFVNIFDDGGTVKMRKADGSTVGKSADGFVLAGVAASATGTCYLSGTNNAVTGLTGGARYFIDDSTPGAVTDTPPSAVGSVVQAVGRGVSATELPFAPTVPMVRA